jgi:hypothetical protein
MTVLADDDVIVHRNAERSGDIDESPWLCGYPPATVSDRPRDGCTPQLLSYKE